MPMRSFDSPKVWTCVENLLKEETEHVCVLPMMTLIKPQRAITVVQIDTTMKAPQTACPPKSANLEPCHDLDLNVSTGFNNDWKLVAAPGDLSVPISPVLSTYGWTPVDGAKYVIPADYTAIGDYTYELPFRLCCAFSDVQGTFKFRSDNNAELFLNDQSLGTSGFDSYKEPDGLVTITLTPENTKSLRIGDNKLVMKVYNGHGITGFALAGRITAKEGNG